MKKEQMVGSRLPAGLVQDLEMFERVEQTDRSTALRRLLHRAVNDWKREHYARMHGERPHDTRSCRESRRNFALGNDGLHQAAENRCAVRSRRPPKGRADSVAESSRR